MRITTKYIQMKKNKKIIIDMIIYYIKKKLNIKLNYYDTRLENILEEYDFVLDYKKEWKKRND